MVQQAQGPWLECPVGVSAGERKDAAKAWVQEVAGDAAGVRVFVVHSEEWLAYERGMREATMGKAQLELEKLKERVRAGKLKAPEKIGAAVARILSRHHGQRYYGWKLEAGELRRRAKPSQRAPVHNKRWPWQHRRKRLITNPVTTPVVGSF